MVNHRVELRGPKLFGGSDSAPRLLERSDRRFMQNLLAELGDPTRHDQARASVIAERKGGGYHLYQPVHRVFHLAVVSGFCANVPGQPRIDPLKIDSAGLVVRKVRDARGRKLGELGWMTSKDGSARWEPPDLWDAAAKHSATQTGEGPASLPFADPDPTRRRPRSTGHSGLDERIAALKQRGSTRAESVTPMFPLTPQACAAAGETMVVGLVPTASRETESAGGELELPARSELEAGGFFSPWLQAGESGRDVPFARQLVTLTKVVGGGSPLRLNPGFADYTEFVRQMIVAYDVAGSSPAATHLRGLLEQISLPFETPGSTATTQRSVYAHLLDAAKVLIDGDRNAQFRMPARWVEISGTLASQIKDAIVGAALARFSGVTLDKGRFAETGAAYVVRAFVRVKRDDGCPPQLVWSQPSPEFAIAPWYDDSPAPRPTIELPNPLRDGLGSIKPNVSFAVPSVISNLLANNDPEDLLGGKGEQPSEGGLMWLCSFSIPIITICAFIILNILISLLNLVFWWLPFVKICIPLPKSK